MIIQLKHPPMGRRLAVGDIHGCVKTLKHLLNEVVLLQKTDQLFLLGDYIDKGPSSAVVLDYLLELIEDGYLVYALRGNHEQNLIETEIEFNPRLFKSFVEKLNKSIGLLDSENKIKSHYRAFIEQMPYCIELDQFYLVHAGFDFRMADPFQNLNAMLEIRHPNPSQELFNGKKIIHGHTPTPLDQIKNQIHNNTIICLDNGCVYEGRMHKIYDTKTLGNLCCLDLDSSELHYARYRE